MALSDHRLDEPPLRVRRIAVFDYGFRPFFLGCGAYAVITMALWSGVLSLGLWPSTGGDPLAWHTHEMLVGFVSAALAGFLLTAVPNWTGRRGYAGRPLMALFALWLAGRVVMLPGLAIPPSAAAVIDGAFHPALAALVLPSIAASRARRNYVFIGLLALLTAGNATFHLDRLGLADGAWQDGRLFTANLILLLVALIGGRIIPSFTLSTLRRRDTPVEIVPLAWLERTSLGLVGVTMLVDLYAPYGIVAGAVAAATALAHAGRLAGWKGLRTGGDPLLWGLHLGYLWIPVGLALKAVWLLTGAPVGQGWVHALTIGSFSTMILAVMSRAALGHTGRPLEAPGLIVPAFVLLSLAALARLAVPLLPGDPMTGYAVAAAAWMVAFGLFCAVYAPILVLPRADGRPG